MPYSLPYLFNYQDKNTAIKLIKKIKKRFLFLFPQIYDGYKLNTGNISYFNA